MPGHQHHPAAVPYGAGRYAARGIWSRTGRTPLPQRPGYARIARQSPDATDKVREIGLFRTKSVIYEGHFFSIRNVTISSGTIINVSREKNGRTNFTVEIDRSENIDALQKTILECLALDRRILKNPVPTVEVETLAPSPPP